MSAKTGFPIANSGPQEYSRPDIVVLRSIMDSDGQIHSVLKTIGDERIYSTNLRVMESQARSIATLSRELLDRYKKAGL